MDANSGSMWFAVCSLIGTTITAALAYLASKHSREANKAVNQRPPGEPNLYSLTRDNRDRLMKIEVRVDDVHERVQRLEEYTCRDPRYQYKFEQGEEQKDV